MIATVSAIGCAWLRPIVQYAAVSFYKDEAITTIARPTVGLITILPAYCARTEGQP